MQTISQAHTRGGILQAGTELIENSTTARTGRPVQMVCQPKAESLTALLRQVRLSNRWENAVWVALGAASLALLVLSFQL